MKILSYSFISASLACLAAAILHLAEPSFTPKPTYDALVSVRMIPYWAGLVAFGVGLALTGAVLRKPFASTLSWWVLLATTGLVGGIKLLHLWEGYHLLANPAGYFGMSNLYEVTLLLGWLLGVVGLYFSRKFSALHLPLALLLLANATFSLWLHGLGVAGPQPLVPALQSYWLPWHVLANFVSYACFLVAGCAGVVVLLSKTNASQQAAATVITQAIGVGFPLFTIAIVLGSVWAAQAWGGYWSWDPKETWALITWLVYAGYLHSRRTPSFTPKKQAYWAIIGFVATLTCYLGVNLFMNGLHSYGNLAG